MQPQLSIYEEVKRAASVVLTIAALAFGAACEAQDTSGGSNEQIAQLPEFNATIPNFAVVSQRLLRGAAPSDEAIKQLSEHGVKTIIDLRLTSVGSAHEKATAQK